MKIMMDDLFNAQVSFNAAAAINKGSSGVIIIDGNSSRGVVVEEKTTQSNKGTDAINFVEPETKTEEEDTDVTADEGKQEGDSTDLDGEASDGEAVLPEVPEGDITDTVGGDVDGGLNLDSQDAVFDMDFGGSIGMPDGEAGTEVKDPLLSNWGFVIGITSGVLLVSIVFGILLAKKRIKKGIDIYED